MLDLLLFMTLGGPLVRPTAQIQPCVWPNRCEKPALVQVQPCVWPNKCEAAPVAQVEPCVWPRKCDKAS